MSRRKRLLGIYADVGRTYKAWAPQLLILGVIVFVPLGLIDALLNEVETNSLNVTEGLKVAAFLGRGRRGRRIEPLRRGVLQRRDRRLAHPSRGRGGAELPPARRHISYGKLIAVDILYVLILVVGTVALVVPGDLVLVYLSLAGPVVELEKHGVSAASSAASNSSAATSGWSPPWSIPIETVGDALNELIVDGVHGVLGHGLIAAWIGEAVGNIVTAPVFSVAIVLLTLDLIHPRDGSGPVLKRRPEPVPAGDAA